MIFFGSLSANAALKKIERQFRDSLAVYDAIIHVTRS